MYEFGSGLTHSEPSETIEKILSDKNKTIEDLLRDEDLLNELNSKNEKLIKYFDKEKIKILLDYIIKEPEIDENAAKTQENKDKGYKFPFVSYQIFGLEINEIYKYFFMTNKQIKEELNKEKNGIDNNNNKKEEEENNEKEKQNIEKNNKENKNNEGGEEKEEKIEHKKKEINVKENNITEQIKEHIENKEIIQNNKEENKKINDNGNSKENKNDIKEEENNKEKKENKENNEKKEENVVNNIKEDNKEEKERNESLENRIELIDHLFTFLPSEFDERKKLNYVLCGYFSSMITYLLDVNPTVFIKYIYKERKDIFILMTSHCYRKSISQALSKLLRYENYFNEHSIKLEEEEKNDMEETRIKVLIDIFSSININMDNEQLNSIYYFITDLFEATSIFEVKDIFKTMIEKRVIARALIYNPLYNLDLIPNLDENTGNKRKNFMIIIDIIIFLLTNIRKLKLEIPTCSSLDSLLSIKHTKISQEIFDILQKLIEVNFNKKNRNEKKILQSFNEYQLSPLGEYKIKIVNLIYYLIPYFKKISKYFDQILIKSNFFKYGFDFLFEYEWNNLYQEAFLSLLKSFLDNSASHELLSNYLFNKLKIFEIIKKYTNNEDKFKFENKDISNNISHGYISFLISLSYKINTVIGGTPLAINTNPSTEGSFEFLPKANDDNDKMEEMNMLYNMDDESKNNKKENKEEDDEQIKKGIPIESMKKYLDDDWRLFFSTNISDVIKQYCNKNWPPKQKEIDIFDFLFKDSNDDNNESENKEENKEINNDKNENIIENKEVNDEKGENNIKNEKENLNDENNDENKEKENKKGENIKVENSDDIKINEENKKEELKEDENKEQGKEDIKEVVKEKAEEDKKDDKDKKEKK